MKIKKIVFNGNRNDPCEASATALSVNITDKNHLALAYNMLYHMMDNGAQITSGGKAIPAEKDCLWVLEQNDNGTKRYTKPRLDPEWYGANRDNFDKGEHLTVASMGNDGVLVRFAPYTASYDKANDMNNFMLIGIDPSVSISYPQDGEMKSVVVNGHPIHEGITDENGQLVTEHFDHDWATAEGIETTYTFTGDRKYELLPSDELSPDDVQKISYGGYDTYYENKSQLRTTTGWSSDVSTVYRIRALRDFGDVKAGDLGGYVESENNLSHEGNCWIYDDAAVCWDAVVKDNATVRGDVTIERAAVVSGEANVFGKARVCDFAQVSDRAQVGWEWDGLTSENGEWKNGNTTVIKGNAQVSGDARVLGEVIVEGNAKIMDQARVEGKWPKIPNDKYRSYYIAAVTGNVVIRGNAQVTNTYVQANARISEDAVVSGHPTMGGHAEIKGNAKIGGHAQILHNVTVNGQAKVSGTAKITEKVSIGYDADIQETGDYFSFKASGKPSIAFQNQDGGLTIVHKGKTYRDVDDFKASVGNLNADDVMTLNVMEAHFNDRMAKSFEEGLASIPANNSGLEQ